MENPAGYTKLKDGSWGLRLTGPEVQLAEGDSVTVTKKSGATKTETIDELVWSGKDKSGQAVVLTTMVKKAKPAGGYKSGGYKSGYTPSGYKPSGYTPYPKSSGGGATDKQIGFIKTLAEERGRLPDVESKIAGGLTKKEASELIEGLLQMPWAGAKGAKGGKAKGGKSASEKQVKFAGNLIKKVQAAGGWYDFSDAQPPPGKGDLEAMSSKDISSFIDELKSELGWT